MRERQIKLRGVTRLHQPTPADPLFLIVIDELAVLAYVHKTDLRRRIEYALALLLSQGRADGVYVIGANQDPRKQTPTNRDLFSGVRVAMRLSEATPVPLLLSPEARDKGARADQISPSLPGVAFVQVDGIPEPVRVRFAYLTDDHIRALCAGWRPTLRLIEGGAA